MACGWCNRAEWISAGRLPLATAAPGGAIFSSFASSCVSLAACQSNERYFLWVNDLFSFVQPAPRRPWRPSHNAVVCFPGSRPASKQLVFYNSLHYVGLVRQHHPKFYFSWLKLWEAHITRILAFYLVPFLTVKSRACHVSLRFVTSYIFKFSEWAEQWL